MVRGGAGSGGAAAANAGQNLDPTQNPSSPYLLHAGESPATILVSPPLAANGSNYHAWARDMKRTMVSKNKFKFLDGSIVVPKDRFDPSYDTW